MEMSLMDFLITEWKDDPERNADLMSGDRVLISTFFISVVLDCHFFYFKQFNAKFAAKQLKAYLRDGEDLLTAKLVMMPLFKPLHTHKKDELADPHYTLYVINRYRGCIDILDTLKYPRNSVPSKSKYHQDCSKIIKRFVEVCEAYYGKEQYKASKQPNWVRLAGRPRYLPIGKQGQNKSGHCALKLAEIFDGEDLVEEIHDGDPRVDDWKAQSLYTLVFGLKNELVEQELPAEFHALAPDA